MTTTEVTPTTEAEFTETTFTDLIEQYQKIQDFKAFVLNRYKVFALAHEQRDIDAELTQAGGYLSVKVDDYSLFNPERQEITIYFHMSEDRGAGTTRSSKFPKVFLFKTTEQEADYASFLELKKKLFPTTR